MMRNRWLVLVLILALPGCQPTSEGTKTAVSTESSPLALPSAAPTSPGEQAGPIPTDSSASMRDKQVRKAVAARFQAALEEMAGGGGMAATVMSADGTWSGAIGKADAARDVGV